MRKEVIFTKLIHKAVHFDSLDKIASQALQIIREAGMPTSSLLYHLDGLHAKHDRFKFIPELCKELKKLGFYDIWKTTSIVVLYDNKMPIHKDVGVDTSLNIPVLNCQGSETIFYKCEGAPELLQLKNTVELENNKGLDVSYRGYSPEQCVEISRVEVTKPTLMNVTVPHTVSVSSKVPRIVIAVRLNIRPEELLNV